MVNEVVLFQGSYVLKNISDAYMQGYKNPWQPSLKELSHDEVLAYEKGQMAARQDKVLEGTF
jgi:hypothetical protein